MEGKHLITSSWLFDEKDPMNGDYEDEEEYQPTRYHAVQLYMPLIAPGTYNFARPSLDSVCVPSLTKPRDARPQKLMDDLIVVPRDMVTQLAQTGASTFRAVGTCRSTHAMASLSLY